jgi:hypothetical protein
MADNSSTINHGGNALDTTQRLYFIKIWLIGTDRRLLVKIIGSRSRKEHIACHMRNSVAYLPTESGGYRYRYDHDQEADRYRCRNHTPLVTEPSSYEKRNIHLVS